MIYDVKNEISKGENIETLADIEELQPVDVDSETKINMEIQSERVGRGNDQSTSQSEIRDSMMMMNMKMMWRRCHQLKV